MKTLLLIGLIILEVSAFFGLYLFFRWRSKKFRIDYNATTSTNAKVTNLSIGDLERAVKFLQESVGRFEDFAEKKSKERYHGYFN